MGVLRRLASLLALCAVLSPPALAQTPAAPENAFEAERLELNPSGIGSMTVGAGELMPASTFRSAVFAHYEHEPLLLVSGDQRQGRIIRERLTLHLMRQYSLAQRIEFALVLPIVVFQSGDDLTSAGLPRLAAGGLASPTLSARVALLRTLDGMPVDVALQAGTSLPFGNAYAFARNPGLTFSPRLLISRHVASLLMVSADVGGVLRPPVPVGDFRIHNELQLNAALSTTQGTLRGEVAARSAYYFDKAPTSLELLLGGRYALSNRVELMAMAGFGALRTPGTPMFRVLFGASFLEGTTIQAYTTPVVQEPAKKKEDPKVLAKVDPVCEPGKSHDPAKCPELDLDSDTLKNAADTCPAAAEDVDGFQDTDGCPDVDNDADGVLDGDDKCPVQAGTSDRGGCPVGDRDGDAVADEQDRCPDEHGVPEREGCPIPDADRDGVADEADKCPQEHGPPDRQGCPLKDADSDGILDAADGCPNDAGPVDARGCPIKDSDGDNVPDHQDNCPNEAGPNRGCKAPQQVFITREKIVILDKIYFVTNSAKLQPRSFPLLQQVASVLKDHPEIRRVVVEGHTDNTGNALKNLRLSRERAESVRRYLIEQGVAEDRLDARGFGQTRPLMPNMTARGREQNRRVEFVIPDGNE